MKSSWRGFIALAVLVGVGIAVVAPQLLKSSPSVTPLPPANPSAPGATVAAPDSAAVAAEEATPVATTAPDVQAQMSALEAAVRENPGDLEALTELAGLYFQIRLYPRAADAFSAALEMDPENARLRNDLGSSLIYQGMVGMAKREYLRAIAIDPSLPDPHFNLAVALSHGDPPDIPRALAEWREAIRLAPDSDLALSAQRYVASYEAQGQGASPRPTPSP